MEVGIFSPRTCKNPSRTKCAVKNCSSRENKNLELRFHSFPKPNVRNVFVKNSFGGGKKVDQLEAWKNALCIRTMLSKNSKVCSLHFRKDDYLLPDVPSKTRILKRTAIPTCNLPGTSSVNKKCIEKNKPCMEGIIIESDDIRQLIKMEQDSFTEAVVKEEFTNEIQLNYDYELEPEIKVEKHDEDISIFDQTLVDVGVQVNTTFIRPKFINFIQNDNQLNTMTGLKSFDILNTIVKLVKFVIVDQFEVSVSGSIVIMDTVDRILMTYVKLKQNLSFSFLAILFNCCTAEQCQRIFNDTIKLLSNCLKAVIPWPSRAEIRKNLPRSFIGFEDVRIALDRTEIFIQNQKNVCIEDHTYSYAKVSDSYKIMTGVTPAGIISYVSKPYDGRISDSTIFEKSELMQLLERGDAVMEDRGFLTDQVCEAKEWECIRSTFLIDKKPYTELKARITKARDDIEKLNQRIKAFEIVNSIMPFKLVPVLEDIFIVICGTINMTSPDDEKLLKVS